MAINDSMINPDVI